MRGILLGQESLLAFVLLTVVIGGGAGWLTGRAIAATWRPWWHVVVFTVPLGAVVRFLHFALFRETMLTPHSFVIDSAVCLMFGLVGFRLMRVGQMVGSYGWINERAGLFRWRPRTSRD